MRFDSSFIKLYLVTDRNLSSPRALTDLVEKAIEGGVTAVQLREKNLSSREFYELALELKETLSPLRVPLIINDRLDIALAVCAEGVHLGQDDLPVSEARRIAGPDFWIGVSVHSLEEAHAAQTKGATYIGVGPVFPTTTKTDAGLELGPEKLRTIAQSVTIPVVAIGGVSASNVAKLKETSITGIAVVSAICAAMDPKEAAIQLRTAMGS